MTDKKISAFDPADPLVGDEITVVDQDGTTVRTTAQAIADLRVIQADEVTNAELANMPAGTVKANLTGAPADPSDTTLAVLAEAIADVMVPALTLVNESSAPSNTYTLLVATDNDGVVLLGGTGRFAKFNWTTFAWTEGTVSGPATISYSWATYIAGSDLIWAGNNSVVHAIDPTTLAATAITANTGALTDCAYNPLNGKVYGFTSSSNIVKEMDATTGVVSRTYAEASAFASGGWYALAVHATTGDVVLLALNTGSGDTWFVVPYVAFNAHSILATVTGQALGASAPGRDRIAIDPVANVAVLGFESYNIVFRLDLLSGVQTFCNSRASAGVGAVYCADTGFLYLVHGTARKLVSRLKSADARLAATASAIIDLQAGHAIGHQVAGADGYLHLLDSTTYRLALVKP